MQMKNIPKNCKGFDSQDAILQKKRIKNRKNDGAKLKDTQPWHLSPAGETT